MLTVLMALISGQPEGSVNKATQEACRVSLVETIRQNQSCRNRVIFEIRHSTGSWNPGYGIVP